MKTPAGFDCRYFYGNYFRGRKQEECRLIGNVAAPHQWTPDLCKKCPVPGIQMANACPNMELNASVKRAWFGLVREVEIHAICHLSQQEVTEPHVGCGQCHPLPFDITDKLR